MAKILCVDDDKDILRMLVYTLSKEGFEVVTLSRPEEAQAYAAKAKPDMVLLDIMMPEMSGYEVCAELRKQPSTAEIPIIFLTALNQHEDKIKALSLGAADFIVKPFDKTILVSTINHHLEKMKSWIAARPATAGTGHEGAPYSIAKFREFLLTRGAPGENAPEIVEKMNSSNVYKVLAGLNLHATDAAKTIAHFSGLPYLAIINPDDIKLGVLPLKFAQGNNIISLRDDSETLLIAVSNPFDYDIMEILQQMIQEPYKLAIANPGAILNIYHVSQQEAESQDMCVVTPDGLTLEEVESPDKVKKREIQPEIDSSPVRYITSKLIEAAIHERASDIHIEPKDLFATVRFRIDGDLREFIKLKRSTALKALSRLKAMAGMDIAERRRPQDGAFVTTLGGRTFTLRLATTATTYGESLTIRLIEPQARPKNLSERGMSKEQTETMSLLSEETQGMLLIAGPTGSGKTTTLYSFLSNIDCQRRSLISVEDPVEYRITHANQQQVNEKAGVTFEVLLKSSVRQDPDILFLGEIRDKASAQIALDFSSTGHLTVSTIHTSNATTAVFRLERLGVSRAQISDTVLAIVSQRLIKRLCSKCKQMKPIEAEMLSMFSMFNQPAPAMTGHPAGCPTCSNTGYIGREAVYEILTMTPEISEMIRSGVSVSRLRESMRDQKIPRMAASALSKVFEGKVAFRDAYEKIIAEELEAAPTPVESEAALIPPADRAGQVYIGNKQPGETLEAGQAKKILLVDDDPDTLLLAGKIIGEAGYEVSAVKNGLEALKRLNSEKFDLVISDIDMPGLDGLSLLEKLDQKNIDAKVVFLTGNDKGDLEERGLELGALDYIRKPVKKEVLLLRIKNILGKRS